MGRIFVTSDTHFGHDREFLWGPRGFSNYMEHDNEVIRRWNEVVTPDDTVFHLGDVMLGDNSYGMDCLAELNGNIKIIPGIMTPQPVWHFTRSSPMLKFSVWLK